MTKLAQTSEVSIVVSFIVMNLEKILSGVISFLFFVWNWLLGRLRLKDMRRESQVPTVLKSVI
ncbi:MAG: hypothetical protein DRP65_04055 [Planctomycetota bacterium]|nr:MAG: hypothetical protein DRP65_04055 [Planctomycetota bacterium]